MDENENDEYTSGYRDGYSTGIYSNPWHLEEYTRGYDHGAEDYATELNEERDNDATYEDNLSDAEADSMTLAGAGYGTDEDYGYYGDDFE